MELKYWAVLTFLGAIWGSAFIFIKIAAPEFGAIGLVQARLVIASTVSVSYTHLTLPTTPYV